MSAAYHCFANFMRAHGRAYRFITDPACTGSMVSTSSISFDMSIMELMLPLCFGKCACIASEEECHNPLLLRDLIVKENVQMAVLTPSFMNNIIGVPEMESAVRGLVMLMLGAEAFTPSLYEAIRRISPDIQLFNGYGPTEAAICCAFKELDRPDGITIGGPIRGMKFYVVDPFGHILPPYAMGELILCGEGVGRGYVKLPEKTAASFFTMNGLPAYHSGDLVRMTAEGEIDFGGRLDNQVKLRGFRVELDEIEKVMCSFDGLLVARVVVRNNGSEDYLAGFFTADRQVDIDALTAHLKSRLTYYMVPSVLMQLDVIPLTPNGKLDKKALPDTVQTERKRDKKRAPKKSLEQQLCEVFASALGREADEVYADDNFFELGGTSLSASKVTMVLMSRGIKIKYGDIFDHPSPEALAAFISSRDGVSNAFNCAPGGEKKRERTDDTVQYSAYGTRDTLSHNMVKYAKEVKRESLGDVLLTGAVGFLGIHVLNELIASETGHIYCLVRRGSHESPEIRLKTMLIYYFSNGFEDGGIPFDPLSHADAPEDYDIDTQIGGLGNFIAVSSVDDAKYEYKDNKNVLTLIKYFEEDDEA